MMQIENDEQILKSIDILASCNKGNFDGSDIPRLTKIYDHIIASGFLIKNIVPFILENYTEIKYFLLGKRTNTAVYFGVNNPNDRPKVITDIINQLRYKKLKDTEIIAKAKSAIGAYLKPGLPDDEILSLSINLLEIEDALDGGTLLFNEDMAREVAAHAKKYLEMETAPLQTTSNALDLAVENIKQHASDNDYLDKTAKGVLRKLNYVEMQLQEQLPGKLARTVAFEAIAARWTLWAKTNNILVDLDTVVDVIDAGISGMI